MINRNDILIPTGESTDLAGPCRVLSTSAKENAAWLIALPRKKENGQTIYYVTGVKRMQLCFLEERLRDGQIAKATHDRPAHWLQSDDDYLDNAWSDKEKEKRVRRLAERDCSYNVIATLVKGKSIEYLAEHYLSIGLLVASVSAVHSVSIAKVYRTLNLFLSSGGVRNALIPSSHKCGGPGKEKRLTKPTGRPKSVSVTRPEPPKNYLLTEEDKKRCAIGYLMTKAGMSPRNAYLSACAAFWSEPLIDENNVLNKPLRPEEQRPSFEQFSRWGEMLSNDAATKLFGSKCNTGPTRHGGSSTDLTNAIGTYAMFDGTSTDVYLTSIYSRNRVLPPMTRSIIKDPLSTAVLGVFVDWQPPSPNTALKTILEAAKDKREYCARFGLEIGEDDWPGMLCRIYLADCGELRASEITDAEKQLHFSIEYARAYSGESKGDVESQHRSDHINFDHGLAGTNKGRRRARGEKHPADNAVLNYYEYMHLLLKYYIRYNDQKVPEKAPLEMVQAGIQPTRINIFKWYRDHHQSAEIKFDITHLTALTLQRWPAVMRETGIFLKSLDEKRVYEHHRFYSGDLNGDPRFERVRKTRKAENIWVRVDTCRLDQVVLPTSNSILFIPNVCKDKSAVEKACFADIDDFAKSQLDSAREGKQRQDQDDLNELLYRQSVESDAKDEQRQQSRVSGGKPSAAKRRKDMRANVSVERDAIGNPEKESIDKELSRQKQSENSRSHLPSAPDAASSAMFHFIESLAESSNA